MASIVEICNMALGNIRSAGINSLNENSLQAQQCKLRYAYVRNMLLTQNDWGFNTVIAPLALLTDTVFNWLYVYQYPTDCLRINRLIPNYEYFSSNALSTPLSNLGVVSPDLNRSVEYKRMLIGTNRVIVSNEQNARAEYRILIDDPNVYDPAFIMAMSWLLAADIAIPIVGGEAGRSLRSDALTMYQRYLGDASASNMNQRYSAPRDSEFVTARS